MTEPEPPEFGHFLSEAELKYLLQGPRDFSDSHQGNLEGQIREKWAKSATTLNIIGEHWPAHEIKRAALTSAHLQNPNPDAALHREYYSTPGRPEAENALAAASGLAQAFGGEEVEEAVEVVFNWLRDVLEELGDFDEVENSGIDAEEPFLEWISNGIKSSSIDETELVDYLERETEHSLRAD